MATLRQLLRDLVVIAAILILFSAAFILLSLAIYGKVNR